MKMINNERDKTKIAQIKIVSPMIYESKCPNCGHVNKYKTYLPVYIVEVKCERCGEEYTGKR
jgi:uncharacterized protein (DUF983 family)